MATLITNLTIRVSRDEMAALRHLGALQQAPVSSVVRAMIRDYLIQWRRDDSLTLDLGTVTFNKDEGGV